MNNINPLTGGDACYARVFEFKCPPDVDENENDI